MLAPDRCAENHGAFVARRFVKGVTDQRHVDILDAVVVLGGALLLTQLTNYPASLPRAIAEHHERLDGTGYPRGLTGPTLGLPDRILAAAVGYQSAREPRPYRAPMSAGDAQRRLRARADAGELDVTRGEAEAIVALNEQVNGRCREWDQAFATNRLLASATLDRLRHNAYCIELDGPSYRDPKVPPTAKKTAPKTPANTAK